MDQNLPAPQAARRRSLEAGIIAASSATAASLVAFSEVAVEVHKNAVNTPNTEALLDIHAHSSGLLETFSAFLAKAASPVVVLVAGLVLAVILFLNRKRLDAWTLAAVLILSAGSGEVLKKVMHNPRPHIFPQIVPAHGYSFPSGHSTMAFALWGFLATWIVSQNTREAWRWVLAIAFIAIAALVCFSRLVLGVHWPTDVIAGALLGIFWNGAVFTVRKLTERSLAK